MAKIHFRHGTVGAGKTAHALMLAYQFNQSQKNAVLVKTSDDTRASGLWSRIGLSAPCITFEELDEKKLSDVNAVIIDEAQFMKEADIEKTTRIADYLDITIIAFGLLKDFNDNLFYGSKRLLEVADEIEEIKSMCWCGKSAKCNGLVEDGEIVKDNNRNNINIESKGEQKFVPLCRKHYNEGTVS